MKDAITVNGMPIEWDHHNGKLTFHGIESILFWQDPSLKTILNPLIDEVGESLYFLLVAYEAWKGTLEDYQNIVGGAGKDFKAGFLDWGRAVQAAGWGMFSFASYDEKSCSAVVVIENPWELNIHIAQKIDENLPFLCGKIGGVFSHAFGRNVRAKVQKIEIASQGKRAWIGVGHSSTTLEDELDGLQRQGMDVEKELRVANNRFKESQRRYRAYFDNRAVGMAVMTLTGEVVEVNASLAEMLGYPPEEIVQKSYFTIISPETRAEAQEHFRCLREGDLSSLHVEQTYRASGGKEIFAILSASVLYNESGEPETLIAVILDITDKKEQEALLIQQSRLAAMGEMIGNIAHQWRQPLNALNLTVANIKYAYEHGKLDAAYLDKSIEKSNKLIQDMSRTINDFRDFFSPDKAMTLIDVQSLVGDAIDLLEAGLKHCNIRIQQDCEEGLVVMGYKNEFSQVVLNLVSNAKDALLEKKTQEPLITLRSYADEENAYLEVQDNAGGIAPAVMPKVFEPYFTTKEQGKGTGIGLYMSKTIIEGHMKGEISVKNGNDGALFTIKLKKGPK